MTMKHLPFSREETPSTLCELQSQPFSQASVCVPSWTNASTSEQSSAVPPGTFAVNGEKTNTVHNVEKQNKEGRGDVAKKLHQIIGG